MFNQSGKAGTEVPWEPHPWSSSLRLHQQQQVRKGALALGYISYMYFAQDKGYGVEYHLCLPPTELCKTEEEIRVAEVFPCLILYTTSM